MKAIVVALGSTLMLAGCTSDGGNWTPTRYIDTPAGQAEQARIRAHIASEQARQAPIIAERKRREAAISACQERNWKRKHSAQLYRQTHYEFEVCS